MLHRSNARLVGVASSELHPPPLPLLPSLNGSSGIRNAIVGSATTGNNNNNATVARGIINHNNPNSKPNQEEHHETRRNGQQQLQSHVLINKKKGITDFQSVNCSSISERLQARHIKGDCDNNDQVRYNRCSSSPPLQSIQDRSSLNIGFSFLNAKRSGTLDSQKLDSFLDSYEQKFGLEPFDMNEVHGLSGKFDIASLLAPPPQQPNRNADEEPEWHRRSVQTFPEKVSQTQMIQSQSHLCSSDLSRLLAATLSDDDFQDKNTKNNNGKDSLSISCKREPLSPIKEESDSEDKRNAAKVPIQSTDSFQETPTMQNGIKDTVTIFDRNSVNGSNAEVETVSIANSDVNEIKKISNDALSTPPPPQQQPQHIYNPKKCNVIGGHEEGNTIDKIKLLENSAAAPKSPIKLPVTSSQSQSPTSLTSTNAAQHDNRPAPRKSRIPVPLQKTLSKSSTAEEVTSATSPPSYLLKRCDNDSNIRKSIQDVDQKQVHRAFTTAAVKVQIENKVNMESNNKIPIPTTNNSTLSRRTIPVPIRRTEKPSVSTIFRRNSEPKIRPLKALSPGKNIGQGDEIASCLSLIDGLSGHTSWVMNKLLECPLPNENAIKRIKRLKESADIGDFFGVPYVSKQILNHTAFQGS